MSKAKQTAQMIVDTAAKYGWVLSVRGSVLTIYKTGINTREDFVRADMEYYSILGLLPTTSSGSIWGTDGGGIGALSAMKSGIFTMHKSGGSVRVLKAIEALC